MKVPAGSAVPPQLPAEPFPRLGEYQLIQKLGQSGPAETYLARRLGPGGVSQQVVLRRLRSDPAIDRNSVERFASEARVAQMLQHPAIAALVEAKVIEEWYCIALEHLEGESLEQILLRCEESGTRMSVSTALLMALTVLDALEYAHGLTGPSGLRRGILHGAICPGNIVIGKGGVLKLFFGQTAGKTSYAAPEQLRSQPVDGRTDLWALGVILFEALTGCRPFQRASEQESAAAVLSDPILSPDALRPELPAEVTNIVLRALVRDPGRRYRSAADMRMEVEQALTAIAPGPTSQESEPLLSEFFQYKSNDRQLWSEKTQQNQTDPGLESATAAPAWRSRKVRALALFVVAVGAVGSIIVARRTGREAPLASQAATPVARLPAPGPPPSLAPAPANEPKVEPVPQQPDPPIPLQGSAAPAATRRSAKPAPSSLRRLTTREAAVAFGRARTQLLGCFEQFGESVAAAAGEITLSVVVAQSGLVREAAVTSPSVGSAALDACLVERVRKLRFRSHPEPEVRINVPFVYRLHD